MEITGNVSEMHFKTLVEFVIDVSQDIDPDNYICNDKINDTGKKALKETMFGNSYFCIKKYILIVINDIYIPADCDLFNRHLLINYLCMTWLVKCKGETKAI